MPLLCCPLLVHDAHRALADALAARDLGADIVEYRLDEFFSGGLADHDLQDEIDAACRLVADSPLPCIATCRPTWEGGTYDGPEDARIALFEALGTLAPPRGHPPRYLDIELAAYTRSANIRQKIHLAVDHPGRARDLAPSLILSIHDFNARPADLTRRILAARSHDACRILKVAYHARSLRDNLELIDILDGKDRPTIALAMGQFGVISRILAPKFGAFLTFASLRPTQTTAPGQPTIRELLDTYRFRAIKPSTRVYGIVGWPIAHSLSPLLHNAGFEAIGHDGVYVPLPIAADTATTRDEPGPAPHTLPDDSYISFKATLLSLIDHPRLDLSGCSVTIPHKQNLVRLAREQGWAIDPIADRCGAANTLIIDRDLSSPPRACRILNTDALAARERLESALGPLSGKSIALIGAGGVARAIAAACAAAGARTTIHARNPDQAAQLATDLNSMPRCLAASMPSSPSSPPPRTTPVRTAPLDDLHIAPHDAIVNCTPLGMRGGPDPTASPADVPAIAALNPTTLFFDTVYNPLHTPFLTAARSSGCPTLDGLDMLIHQAAAQFTAWTSTPAPTALFARIAREANP